MSEIDTEIVTQPKKTLKTKKIPIPVGMVDHPEGKKTKKKPNSVETDPETGIQTETKVIRKNALGQILNKDGSVSKRGNRAMNSVLARAIQEAKKNATVTIVESDSSESEDDEFEIEEIVKKKKEPQVVEVPVEVPVIDQKTKEEYLRAKKELEEEKVKTQKLQEKFNFNTHLNRISHMSTQVKMKF